MGPLSSLRVVELSGLGPAPFCGMVLADLGAHVIRIDRPASVNEWLISSPRNDVLSRGKRSIAIDLKSPEGVDLALELIATADALIEGYRPGVTERLGLGPAVCLARNERLVYGRMTGWGQTGRFSSMAGHDIDYIALSGALGSIGTGERPVPPLNLVGDFGGGGMLLALGVLAAVLKARESGRGQTVDAAMVDGSALLMASHHGFLADGWWSAERESNLLDGAAPFYTTYETSDGRHMAVGALEPQFYAALLAGLELEARDLPSQMDRDGWPLLRESFAEKFRRRTRDEWEGHFAGTDACVAPVLTMDEAPSHPHIRDRASFVSVDGVLQPAPAPRFDRTPTSTPSAPVEPGTDSSAILAELGFSPDQIGRLRESGVVA
jgi:alpha-methylacyl-CoA racemase